MIQSEPINMQDRDKIKAKDKDRAFSFAIAQAFQRMSPERFHAFVQKSDGVPNAPREQLERLESDLTAKGVRLLYPGHPEWPTTMPSPELGGPHFLYARGPGSSAGEGLAVVGSRTCEDYPLRVTRQIVRHWSLLYPDGYVVTGGGMGVDAAALRAAIDFGLKAVVVFASGVVRPTPRTNAALFEEIVRNGVFLSENGPGRPCFPPMFPFRNRLIPWLAAQTVVVRAALPSGSFHTLSHASRTGNPLWVVLGELGDAGYRGNVRGVRLGWANPLLSVEDLGSLGVRSKPNRRREKPADVGQQRVLKFLERGAAQTEDVAENLGLTASVAMRDMLSLELKGLVSRDATNCYRAVPHSPLSPKEEKPYDSG